MEWACLPSRTRTSGRRFRKKRIYDVASPQEVFESELGGIDIHRQPLGAPPAAFGDFVQYLEVDLSPRRIVPTPLLPPLCSLISHAFRK